MHNEIKQRISANKGFKIVWLMGKLFKDKEKNTIFERKVFKKMYAKIVYFFQDSGKIKDLERDHRPHPGTSTFQRPQIVQYIL